MPTPAYMWINEGQIKGSVVIGGREDSIEIMAYSHDLHIPTDVHTGRLSGIRTHGLFAVTKAVDRSSPELFKALCEGLTLDKVEIKLYQIDDAGVEVNFFTYTLQKVKVAKIESVMPHTKNPNEERHVQQERVSFAYGVINWLFVEGAIEHEDAWESSR